MSLDLACKCRTLTLSAGKDKPIFDFPGINPATKLFKNYIMTDTFSYILGSESPKNKRSNLQIYQEYFQPNFSSKLLEITAETRLALGDSHKLRFFRSANPCQLFQLYHELVIFHNEKIQSTQYLKYLNKHNVSFANRYQSLSEGVIFVKKAIHGIAMCRPIPAELLGPQSLSEFLSLSSTCQDNVKQVLYEMILDKEKLLEIIYQDIADTYYFIQNVLVPRIYGLGRWV
jgi:hypothetical protein